MKLGIIGLPLSGKSTVFEALTQNSISAKGYRQENSIGTVKVPDWRLDFLNDLYKPERQVFAQVEYFLPGLTGGKKDEHLWSRVKDCDALIFVIRNFGGYGFEQAEPLKDFKTLDQELVFNDLVIVEKKIERIKTDRQRRKNINNEEFLLLEKCLEKLENEQPLRMFSELATAQLLKGYTFLSAKPVLALFNNEDDNEKLPLISELSASEDCMVIRGKLEQELSQMSDEEAGEFLTEFSIAASAMDRVIKRSYGLLGLISFFTVGTDEVRAWTVRKNTKAVDAAGVIHTDMQKGFIRAEVVSFDHLYDAGNFNEARKRGHVRLEGKTYPVQDGDIITFRFNV